MTLVPIMASDPPWHFLDLGIPALQAQSRGEGIRVAVLDSGVAHIDGLFKSLKSMAPDGTAANDMDATGHGTACCSLIASLSGDAPGVAPDAELISIPVVVGGEVVETLFRQALQTAVKSACHIISCSFTLPQPDQSTLDAIRDVCNRGIVVVAATGNDPSVASGFPERTPNVLVIGPYGHNRELLQSRFGLFTDVLAPGIDLPVITATAQTATFGESSAATAVTAGVVALVLSATHSLGTARVGLALEGLSKSTALMSNGARLLDPNRLLHAAQQLP
jgi:subtilisin family serine protease